MWSMTHLRGTLACSVDAKSCVRHISSIGGANCTVIVQNSIEHGLMQLMPEICESMQRLSLVLKLMCYLNVIEIDTVILGKLLLDNNYWNRYGHLVRILFELQICFFEHEIN